MLILSVFYNDRINLYTTFGKLFTYNQESNFYFIKNIIINTINKKIEVSFETELLSWRPICYVHCCKDLVLFVYENKFKNIYINNLKN